MKVSESADLLIPDWPAPSRVRAVMTTRAGGVSTGPYASLNLGEHVGDDPGHVLENRRRLVHGAALPSEPRWLKQVHGIGVVDAAKAANGAEADASVATQRGIVCAVMTADCLPVLLCDEAGSVIAAAHAGWRGLVAGVLEQTVRALPVPPKTLMAWLGPAIGPDAFEVGPEVRDAFVQKDGASASAFRSLPGGKFAADLFALARQRLSAIGVKRVYGGGVCTVSDASRFFSHRRDRVSGRMAALVWLAP